MKKKIFWYAAGLMLFATLANRGSAQNSNYSSIAGQDLYTPVASNHPTHGTATPAVGIANSATINAKALKNFNQTHKNATDVNWFVIKDGFLAEFEKEGVKTKVYYDLKGNNLAAVRLYFEDKLPRDIRHMVKSNYYDYNIYFVREVTILNKTAYLVQIEDKTSFKTIRIVDSESKEMEALAKSL